MGIEEKPESREALPIPAGTTSCAFPEGGLQAWLTVLGVWITQFSTFGYTNAYGVYNDFYVREYMVNKYTSSQMSWVGSVQLMLVLSVGLISGRLYDTGYFYHLMIGGAILFIFCLFMLSLTQPGQYYQIILAQGFGAGLAIGLVYVPGISVVSHYFQCRRPFAMGVATSGSGLGGVIQPIMLNKLFHGPVGFHNGVRISAAFNAGLLLIAIPLMRTRLPPSPRKGGNVFLDMSRFFREGIYATTVAGTIITVAGLFFPVFFLQLNAVKNGISSDVAFYAVGFSFIPSGIPVMNVFTVVGRIFWPAIVPWIGIYNVVIACVGICSILIFCSIAVKTVAATFTFAALYGLFAGGYMGLFAPMIGSLARKDSEIGARMGICFTFTGKL
ncbi:major facilitator superfamily domain-containing protein [Armillaria borealis]|uniref:Major facilitator superfamily domain-containing protein n=1 Tax=Armillaria borealis TaxID=47425 RepID=A0AA39MIS0_9AGAR|nr:major facilitator superfamily domain-containing protein [Armillaria borealis]